MPKRSRCSYCNRLFGRDQLDAHIVKCRAKHTKRVAQHTPNGRKNLVLDGNNIAYYLSPDNIPHIANIVRAYKSLSSGGYRSIIVISAALKHKIDKPNILQSLIIDGYTFEAPRRKDDDLLIIEEAQKRNADIVSNDRFLNWTSRYPWVTDRLRRYRLTPAGLLLV
ncbi:MAG: NYN domain-containing protein [Candidatus Thorarchaeota archaeon]